MPHNTPKSLSNNEVYALTAYVLYLNDFIDQELVLDQTTLPGIVMPASKRNVSAWE
jgi:cytochrome c